MLSMKMKIVESSMIHSVGYEPKTQSLDVTFNSGKTYRYFEVPEETYQELMAADSKGGYMRDAVIDCYTCIQQKNQRRRSR
jgi:uncharacterized protein CbrC (UPF0167 family)